MLLALQFILLLAYVATQADNYGRTWDEPLQDRYGETIFQFYRTFGDDRSFLMFPESLHLSRYGPFFEFVVAFAQHLFGDHWHTRAVVCGIAGVLGIAAIALCGFQLGGWWGALLAATGLTLYPRYLGAIFNNSKDVPLAAALIFVLWATIRLARRWDATATRRVTIDAAIVGGLIGIATSIRAIAVIWFGMLVLLAVGWWLRHGRRAVADGSWLRQLRGQVLAGAMIGLVSYLVTLAVWPFILLNPVSGLPDAILLMSSYDWPGSVLFDGQMVVSKDLPWNYAPQWLVVGSPPMTIGLALAGIAFIMIDLFRRRPLDTGLLLAGGLMVVPLATIVILGSTLYNGLRQFLFVVPGMILLGVAVVIRMWSALSRQRHKALSVALGAALGGAVVAGHAEAAFASVRLYPLEYVYFSPLVNGFAGAHDRYEGDYWRACETVALRWVGENPGVLPTGRPATVAGYLDRVAYATLLPLPAGLRRATAAEQPDVVIVSRWVKARPGYETVHDVRADGVGVCSVQVNRSPAAR